MRTYGKDTASITARVGESFALELPAMATAGFRWHVIDAPDVVTLGDEGMRPARPGIGGASVQAFSLAATRAGAGTLLLEYKRSWEATPGDRFAVEIVVES